jgi:hypothetical protein
LKFFIFILSVFFAATSFATPQSFRWTGTDDKASDFPHVLEILNTKSKAQFAQNDFLKIEERDLASSHFVMYVQTANQIPVAKTSLRIWSSLTTGKLIQAEAFVESPADLNKLIEKSKSFFSAHLIGKPKTRAQLLALARSTVLDQSEDKQIRDVKTLDQYEGGTLVRVFKLKAKHGTHVVRISLLSQMVLSHQYQEFPNADSDDTLDEFSIPASVFPIYEETEDLEPQARIAAELKHLKQKTVQVGARDLYAALRSRQYLDRLMDPVLGLTPEGQANGAWAMSDIKRKASALRAQEPLSENSVMTGAILEGRYASVNIHPDASSAFFSQLNFAPTNSSIFYPVWRPAAGKTDWEMVPSSGFLGRPLQSVDEALNRPAVRLPDHNPAQYMKDGFDEVQVYYAINTLFESLHIMGFADPELSTRPFHAFLYDPDIGSRDNAYYTDDTINFTTYSSKAQNYARDNSTIWHELGHGIMERLMGDELQLADTGGLSEGMADFVAELVIQETTKGLPFQGQEKFRIVNNTGFHLTNEVHDDGEAYGGVMRDMLVAARAKFGPQGLTKMGDLTMETMRLTRNHPALTAEDWFSHMLFADELGKKSLRTKGEFKDLILTALGGRNFNLGTQSSAQFLVSYQGSSVESGSPGSRNQPINLNLGPADSVSFPISIQLIDGDVYKFKYPLTVRVQYEGWALQGAIHWDGQDKKFVDYPLKSANEALDLVVTAHGTCDEINTEIGGCKDYVYFQVLEQGAAKPIAKKRFYLRVLPKP